MASSVIHIFGASGSGTSTLGAYIAARLGYTFMDTDDYFWKPTNPPYKEARPVSERLELMKSDIAKFGDTVISGSLSGWGDSLIRAEGFIPRRLRRNKGDETRLRYLMRTTYPDACVGVC